MSKKKDELEAIRRSILPIRVSRKELPDVGELVIGTVYKILDHGAYVLLDEYGGLEAYAPINEIIYSWFHDIKDYLRVGQKTVFRVIRVDSRRKLVDVSYKKVKDEERKEKMYKWKRTLRGVKLLELVANRLGIPLEKALEEFGWKLEEYFGDFLAIFEHVAKYGPDELRKLGLPENIVQAITEVARERIEIEPVKISGVLRVVSIRPDGVKHVREVLTKALEIARGSDGVEDVKLYTIGPPRYKIDLIGKDPRKLEQALKNVVDFVTNEIRRRGGEASFTRVE